MNSTQRSSFVPTIIIGALFFVFGFVTWLNGTLIPYLKIACGLTEFQSMFVTLAFYISYFVMALPSSWILEKTGFKKGMMLGLLIMAAGALLFIPAANTRTYGLFLTGLFVIGTGLTILQTAVNPYITIVGPIESAAKRISIMGVCSKAAGIAAPLIMGAIILSDADALEKDIMTLSEMQKNFRLDELASRVIVPYTLMAVVLCLLALMIRFSPLPEIEREAGEEHTVTSNKDSILAYPHLILGIIALFLYVGVEVVAADTIGPYGRSQGIPLSVAKNFTSYTLFAMLLGYFVGIFTIPNLISQSKALAISAATGIVFSLVVVFTHGYVSVLFIALLGLSNALMWPAIWPLAIEGLGRHTKRGSALLIMAIIGGATLPVLWGFLADIKTIGHRQAYWIMVPCYLFILFYSLKGHKIKRWIDQRKTT